jgi:hypothetical protein
MLDVAVRMQQATVRMDFGHERRTLQRAAQVMRLASSMVVDGRWGVDVGEAYIAAANLTMKVALT